MSHPAAGNRPVPVLLVAVASPAQAASARADGADLIEPEDGGPSRDAPAGPVTDLTGETDPDRAVAIAAVSAWRGTAVIRVRPDLVRPVRRALDMTATIAGHRPPVHATRALA